MSEAAPVATPVRLTALFAKPRAAPRRPTADELQKQGFAAGRAAADAEWQPRFEALEATFYAARDDATARAAQQEAQARAAADALHALFATELARLAHAIAAQVLAAQPAIAPETLAALIHQALAAAAPGDTGTLHVAPALLEHTRALLPAGWALAADPALAPGELLAETGPLIAIATLADRLADVAARLGIAE
jgi:flagellar biosynthesis/type III secretory pathway protein FliH